MIDLVVVLSVGIIAIIITVIVGFVFLRIDNSRTVRENIRLQTALARQGQGSGSYTGQSSDAGELGWLGEIITGIIKTNPELVTNLLGNVMKKE